MKYYPIENDNGGRKQCEAVFSSIAGELEGKFIDCEVKKPIHFYLQMQKA